MAERLTTGSVARSVWRFSLPYLLASLLQTLYGLADVFVIGLFHGPEVTAAVTNGAQVMHFLTVVISGVTMGVTVSIGQSVGAENEGRIRQAIGTTVAAFLLLAAGMTAVLLFSAKGVVTLMQVPPESAHQARQYLSVCCIGLPFIMAYNVISAIFRGLGDTKRPMVFVAVACAVNIALDFVFIGLLGMKATGAALATILSQGVSVIVAVGYIRCKRTFPLTKQDIRLHREAAGRIFRVGLPVACQDAFIQISFLLITVIANRRGLAISTAVGVVEKIIGILFLVNSAMLSTVSAVSAQNIGAGEARRARQVLYAALAVVTAIGVLIIVICQFHAEGLVNLFVRRGDDPALLAEVLRLGGQYLRSYCFDCLLAGLHFCFSGYFCAIGKSWMSFVHNIAAIVLVRIPGAYLTAVLFPDTLYPMGWAAPLGSLLSTVICLGFFLHLMRRDQS